MEMHLQPLATTCSVSGEPFVEGARVASFLVRQGAALEITRYDLLETHAATFTPEGVVACSWVQPYKPRKHGENADRALKLTAEHLFVALADPTTEPTPENTRLVQFLALMLERKKILRPRGKSADGARNRYEHAKSKQMFEVPAGELTPEFFVAVQQQLSVLVGAPRVKAGTSAAPAAAAAPAGEGALPVSDNPAPPAPEPAPAAERAEATTPTGSDATSVETDADAPESTHHTATGEASVGEAKASPEPAPTDAAEGSPVEPALETERDDAPDTNAVHPVKEAHESASLPSTRGGSGGTAAA